MKDKLKNANIPVADQKLIRDVAKTRSVPALTELVRAAIHRRDVLLEKGVDGGPDYRFDRISESSTRKRVRRMCDAIEGLQSRKSVSLLCGAAIARRREMRAAQKGSQ